MTLSAANLAQRIQTLKQQRKAGTLSLRAYYRALLELMSEVSASLQEEINLLPEEEIAQQVPLILLFLEEQIRKFGERSTH